MLEPVALALAALHLGVPLTYYAYATRVWLKRPWGLRVDDGYRPRVTVIVPTYNEAETIARRLDNIYEQDYPRELVEVIVVDSASTDGTPEIVERWIRRHRDANVKLIREDSRRGMVPAINFALRTVEPQGEIVFFTDADAWWPPNAIRSVVKYFADGSVGAVSTSVVYEDSGASTLENVYRSYYNKLRVSESKRCCTPVHNGPLVAFRKELLYKIGLLPEYTGNNDSTPASVIAFAGYRAIQVDDVVVKEYVRGNQFWRRVRRAQHLVVHFLKTRKWAKDRGLYNKGGGKSFEAIWWVEWWLHLVNPWLLLASLALLLVSCVLSSTISVVALSAGVMLLLSRTFRAWVINQLYLVIAAVRCAKSIDIAWAK